MPAAIPEAKRAAILTDITAKVMSRNAIARKHEVSPSTVTGIAKEANQSDAFDRSNTKNATRARQFDAKAARAQLIQDLYEDAQRFRARSWEPYTQIATVAGGPGLVTTNLPPLRDQQAGYTALAICVDKAAKLEAVDSDGGAAVGRTMIGDLRSALGLAYDALGDEEAAASVDPEPDTAPDNAE